MRLQSLSLQHFRSYRSLEWELPGGDLSILLGPNAAGKTNLLEAIALASSGRSFLGAEEDDLMTWGAEHYRVRAAVRSDAGEPKTIEVVSQRAPRRARAGFLNDVRVPIGRLTGELPAVTFLPQDLTLFTGSPARRRDLLNDLLAQISPEVARSLQTYQKVLKQRNALLRKIADGAGRPGDLAVWDEALAAEGAVITLAHLELLKVLQCTLEEEMATLGESWERVSLNYDRRGLALTREELVAEFLHDLLRFRERDLLLQATTIGPHRHDWHIAVDGRNLSTFASRGQQRTAVLALLFLQVSYVEVRRGEKPVILLDDVFSELDQAHQECLLQNLSGHQVFLTATHPVPGMERAEVWEVGAGRLEQDVGRRIRA